MNETQQSISQWADETLGAAGSNARVVARANEEMAELLRALTSDNHDKAAEEAADVMIVLFRVAERMRIPVIERSREAHIPWGRWSPFQVAASANADLATMLLVLGASDDSICAEVPAIYHHLDHLCKRLGTTLEEQIDRKMEINRARVWKRDGTGHGYHVREK